MHPAADILMNNVLERPDSAALVSSGHRLTFAGLATQAGSLAGFLASRGLRKGDRVAIFLENSPEAVLAIFATLQAGGCIVVVNPVVPPERLAWILSNCDAKFLFASASTRRETLHKALEYCKRRQPSLIQTDTTEEVESAIPDAWSFDRIVEAGYPPVTVHTAPTDLAAIIYTSGSTGMPKGVTFLHGNVDAATRTIAGYLEHSGRDVVLSALPLASSYGLLQLLVPLGTGGRVVLEKGMGLPYDFVLRIKEEGVTGFAGNPTLFAILLRLEGVENEELSSLRYITNAASALPVTFIPRLQKMFPTVKLFLMHGLTECFRTSYLPPEEVNSRPTSIGKGLPNMELWIQDEDGRRLGPGETGELLVRGPSVMQGYWNNPEESRRAIMGGETPWDNVLHTNDLFRMDDEGYFHFVARKDELIKSRGEKVSPVEVEDVVYRMEEVLEVRVMGVPDPVLGTAIKAEVVPKRDHSLTAHQVKAYCRRYLEEFKVPQVVEIVSAIPRTQAGKIRRKADGEKFAVTKTAERADP